MALYPSESEKINMKSIFQKITVQKVVKGFRYLKHYGWKEFIIRLQEKMEAENVPYEPWYEKHKATAEQIEKQKKQAEKWNDAPKISIVVPLFKTPETFLLRDDRVRTGTDLWQLAVMPCGWKRSRG